MIDFNRQPPRRSLSSIWIALGLFVVIRVLGALVR